MKQLLYLYERPKCEFVHNVPQFFCDAPFVKQFYEAPKNFAQPPLYNEASKGFAESCMGLCKAPPYQ